MNKLIGIYTSSWLWGMGDHIYIYIFDFSCIFLKYIFYKDAGGLLHPPGVVPLYWKLLYSQAGILGTDVYS